jgi:hypothetical protein
MRVRLSWEKNEFPENLWDRLNKHLVGSTLIRIDSDLGFGALSFLRGG